MTFSIAARCADSGQLGVAVTSSSICVASRCARVSSGVGAALSQNVTDPALGPALLELCRQGLSAEEALQQVVQSTPAVEHRQLALIDHTGSAVFYSGDKALGLYAGAVGSNCVSAGNLLANEKVPEAIVESFESTTGALAERLIGALLAGEAAGGEAGPVKSAGVMVAQDASWPIVDLRVDWDEANPLTALKELWKLYQPQAEDYRTRALDPEAAPSYGVPGDT